MENISLKSRNLSKDINKKARPEQGRRVYIKTFGCQMNKLDSELSIGSLIKEGYTFVEDEEIADIVLFNTCSVRQKAEDKVYSYIGSLRKQKEINPDLTIGVLGCMAQNGGK